MGRLTVPKGLQPRAMVIPGPARAGTGDVLVKGSAGTRGALLSGWAEAEPIGPEVVAEVAAPARARSRCAGGDVIEWAAWGWHRRDAGQRVAGRRHPPCRC